MFVFQKIWLGLFSWNTRFEIRLFALSSTIWNLCLKLAFMTHRINTDWLLHYLLFQKCLQATCIWKELEIKTLLISNVRDKKKLCTASRFLEQVDLQQVDFLNDLSKYLDYLSNELTIAKSECIKFSAMKLLWNCSSNGKKCILLNAITTHGKLCFLVSVIVSI